MNWITTRVDESGDVGKFSSIALDSEGQPHISYIGNGNLKYAHWNGSSWIIDTIDGAYRSTSLALNAKGRPYIAYYDIANSALKFAYWNGSNWNTTTVDSGGSVGRYASLALDSEGRPHISYYDGSNENLKYAHRTNSGWVTTTVVSSSDTVGKYTSIEIDRYDNPHISHFSSNLHDVYEAHYNQPPETDFTYSPLNPGPDETITFDASGSNDSDGSIETYKWDWDGDGAFEDTLSSPTVGHTFSDAGEYSITSKVIDNDGSSNASTKTVSVQSNQVVLTLDGVSVTECGVSWTESGAELSFVKTTGDDCMKGMCEFGTEADSVWLWPARLRVDLIGLAGTVTSAEVDVMDQCDPGCTKAFLYEKKTIVDQTSNTVTGNPETLTLKNPGAEANIDRLAVSSCEGEVLEIRLYFQNTSKDLAPGWQLFSPPGIPQNPDPEVALGDDIDPLTLFYDYSPTGGYTIYPDETETTELTWKRGHWFNLADETRVDTVVDVPSQNYTKEFTREGWWLVGVPYPVDWSEVSFSDRADFANDGAGNVRLVSWNPSDGKYLNHYTDAQYVLSPWVYVKQASSIEPAEITISKTNKSISSMEIERPLPQTINRDQLDYPPLPNHSCIPGEPLEVLAHPNPVTVNNQVKFTVHSGEKEEIKVKIMNAAGKIIYDSNYSEGNELAWKLFDQSGDRIANGIYLYKVKLKGAQGEIRTSEVGRLLVMR